MHKCVACSVQQLALFVFHTAVSSSALSAIQLSVTEFFGANSTSERQSERLEALKPIVWVHTQKTGSTFINTLTQHPGICPGHVDLEPVGVMDSFQKGVDDELYSVKHNLSKACPGAFHYVGDALSTHAGFAEAGAAGHGHGVMFFRQPEQRLMSNFYYQQKSDEQNILWEQNWTLMKYAQVNAGCQVKMLVRTGEPCKWQMFSSQMPSQKEVTLAIQRLYKDIAFVGITGQWALSICLFHAMFGGNCQASEFLDTRPGPNHSSHLYDTTELGGYHDIFDGALYHEAQLIFNRNLRRFNVNAANCPSSCRPTPTHLMTAN